MASSQTHPPVAASAAAAATAPLPPDGAHDKMFIRYPHISVSQQGDIRYPDISAPEHGVQEDIAALSLDNDIQQASASLVDANEEVLLSIPGVIVHLIDQEQSVHLASGDFSLVQLTQSGNGIAVLARVGADLQWPLTKDEAAVRLDQCHYFFTLRVPSEIEEECRASTEERNETSGRSSESILNYGLTFTSADATTLQKLDDLLKQYSFFTTPVVQGAPEAGVSAEIKQEENDLEGKRNLMPSQEIVASPQVSTESNDTIIEEGSAEFWTTLAPDVEDYSSSIARAIAAGAGNIIKGLFWCSNATVTQLEGGNKFIRERLKAKEEPTKISPSAVRRLERVQRISLMCEQVATGVLSGVVKAAAFVTRPIVQSKAGQKILHLLPGEIALASLDAFGKVFDAVEVAGKNVLTTTSLVTTGLVSQRYGEEAAKFTQEGLTTAGHFLTTAWTISKIRNVFNPAGFAKSGVRLSTNEVRVSTNEVSQK